MKDNYAMYKRIEEIYHSMLNTDTYKERDALLDELMQFRKEDGSFSLLDTLIGDGDVVIAYAYETTYYACASMIFKVLHDGIDEEINDVLLSALQFALRGYFPGHGYDAEDNRLAALKIFREAGAYEYITKGYEGSDLLKKTIEHHIEDYRLRLKENRTIGGFGTDYAARYEEEVTLYDLSHYDEVWYAAYGSNLSEERFMRYINRCTNKRKPAENRAFLFPTSIFFTGHSTTWNGSSAFLDLRWKGRALGRIWRITTDQFKEIMKMEGKNYTRLVRYENIDGLPVCSFTCRETPKEDDAPSKEYLDTMKKGLRETYDLYSDRVLEYYLYSCAMSYEDIEVLETVRHSEHAVPLNELKSRTDEYDENTMKKSAQRLVHYGLLKFTSDNTGRVYSDREYRDLIDTLILQFRM